MRHGKQFGRAVQHEHIGSGYAQNGQQQRLEAVGYTHENSWKNQYGNWCYMQCLQCIDFFLVDIYLFR